MGKEWSFLSQKGGQKDTQKILHTLPEIGH
jgi:hypothetical protein